MFVLFRKLMEWAGLRRVETPKAIGPFSRDLTWRVLWHVRDNMVREGYSISANTVMDAWEELNEFYESSPAHVFPSTYSGYYWDAKAYLTSQMRWGADFQWNMKLRQLDKECDMAVFRAHIAE